MYYYDYEERATAKQEPFRFKTDFNRACLLKNAEARDWIKTQDDEDWNFYWGTVSNIRRIFSLENGFRLRDDQIVNHFPNHYELTRKDLMVKNIKRYRKYLERIGDEVAVKNADGAWTYLDFFPTTYNLPADYSLFELEFKKNTKQKWIMKPTARAQGAGIFIINKLIQLKRWANGRWSKEEPYVVSKYLERPLLIGGKKFDLRLYVLVTSYRPLRVYYFHQGFARFSNVRYSNEKDQMNNIEMHLTNVAIQKHGDEYNTKHGNKWSVKNVKLYLRGVYGEEVTNKCFKDIEFIIIHSLFSVQNQMINDKHCFECYGYDIIIDEKLKPWLIEINASPSLSATTRPDRILKQKLLSDLMDVVVPSDAPSTQTSKGYVGWNRSPVIGNFELIYDEELNKKEEPPMKKKKKVEKLWR